MTTMTTGEYIKGIPSGKLMEWTADTWRLIVRHLRTGDYVLDCAWPVPDAHDEDPESILCGSGCPYQGRSHAHATRTYPAIEIQALVAATEQALADKAARRPVSFAAGERVG